LAEVPAYKINKIVYRIFDNHIKVYDFWDVRREPNYLVKNNPKNKIKTTK